MSFDAFRKKKREKAIADDAKMGATYLGTSIKNAELGDTGNRPMKLPGAGSSESSNSSTTISSAPAINTSSKTAISDVATKVRDLESYRSTLENTRKQLQTSASNTDYMSQQRKLNTVNNLISSVESQLSDLKSQRPDYDRKEAQSKYDAYEAAEVELAKKYGSVEKLLDDIDAQYADLQRRERQLKETEKKVQDNPADPVLQKLYKAQYQNYQNVFDKYQALYADLNGMQTAWAAYTDYGTAANDSLKSSWNRALQAMKGAGEGQVSGNADALTTAYAKGQKQRSLQNAELLKENQAALDKAKATLKEMVASRSKNPGSIQDSEIKSQQNIVADLQRKVDALAKSDTVQAQATGAAHRLADRIQEISSRDIQLAKEGTGKLGGTLLDATVAGTQLGLDIITGRLLGIGGKSSYIDDLGRPATMNQLAQAGTAGSIAMRGFGAAAQQARQAGASVDEQVAYGLLSALLEVGTEKAMSVGKLNSKILGKGALEGLEDALKEMVYAVEKQGKTAAGRAALNRLASMGAGFVSEGFEEGFAALIDPILQKIYSSETIDWGQVFKDARYDALVGGLLGMVTSGVGGTDTSKFRAAEADMTASVDTATARTYNKPEMVSAAAAPEIQQAAAQVATVQAENPGADVLSTAQTEYLNAGIVAKIPKAKRNALIVQNLIEGKKVDDDEIDKLALSQPNARAVFTKLTGVQFPTNAKLTPELLRNLARSAHTVAQEAAVQQAQAVAQRQAEQDAVNKVKADFQAMQAEQEQSRANYQPDEATQTRIAEAQASLANQVSNIDIGPDGKPLATLADFAKAYRATLNPDATDGEIKQQYKSFRDGGRTVLFGGHRLTRAQFGQLFRENGKNLTDEQLDALFNGAIMDTLNGEDGFDRYTKKSDSYRDSDTLKLSNGGSITRKQYRAFLKELGKEVDKTVTDAFADQLFDQQKALEAQGKTQPYVKAMDKFIKEENTDDRGTETGDSGEVQEQHSDGRGSGGDRRRGSSSESVGSSDRNTAAQSSRVQSGQVQQVGGLSGLLNPRTRKAKIPGIRGFVDVVYRSDYTEDMKTANRITRKLGFRLVVTTDSFTAVFNKGVGKCDGQADHRNGILTVSAKEYGSTTFMSTFRHELFHLYVGANRHFQDNFQGEFIGKATKVKELTGMRVSQFLNDVITNNDYLKPYQKDFAKGGFTDAEQTRLLLEELFAELLSGNNDGLKLDQAVYDELHRAATAAFEDVHPSFTKKIQQAVAAKSPRINSAELAQQQDTADKESSEAIDKPDRAFSMTKEKFWDEQLDSLDEIDVENGALYIKETPNILAEVGLGDLPMSMTTGHIRDAMHEKSAENNHWHGVPESVMMRLPDLLSRPAMILKSRTRKGDVLVVTTATDNDGLPVVASIHPDGSAVVDGQYGPVNFITSVYGRNNFAPRPGELSENNLMYLALKERGILYWNKKRTEQLAQTCGLRLPKTLNRVPSDTILGYRDGYVKDNIPARMFSMSKESPAADEITSALDEAFKPADFKSWDSAFVQTDLGAAHGETDLCFSEPPFMAAEMELVVKTADGLEVIKTYPKTEAGLKEFNNDWPKFLADEKEGKGVFEHLSTDEDVWFEDADFGEYEGDESDFFEIKDYSAGYWDEDPGVLSERAEADEETQGDREGFTDIDSKNFKKWWHDDSGALTNPDGKPKVFLRGSDSMGATKMREAEDANSSGSFFTTIRDVAKRYADGVTTHHRTTIMDQWNPYDNLPGREWVPHNFKTWNNARLYVRDYYTDQRGNIGLNLYGTDKEGNVVPISRADFVVLESTVKLTDSGVDATGRDWENLKTYPATKAGLKQLNQELGDHIRTLKLGSRGYGKFYLSAKNTFVFDANDDNYGTIRTEDLPQKLTKYAIGKTVHINDLAKAAFENGYDCVVVHNVEDDGGVQTQYIIRDPEQVKSVYNTGAWSSKNKDFMYSMSKTSEYDEFLSQIEKEYGAEFAGKLNDAFYNLDESKQAAVGAANFGYDPYNMLMHQYGNLEPGEKPDRVFDAPAQTDDKHKVSQTPQTVGESGVTPEYRLETIRDAILNGKLSYLPKQNKVMARKAEQIIKRDGWNKAIRDWTADVRAGKASAELTAMGATLLNNAGNSGEVDGKTYVTLLVDYADLLRRSSQGTQAARILKNLTPEGRLYGLQGYVTKINEQMRGSSPADNVPVEKWMEVTGEQLAERLMQRAHSNKRKAKTTAQIILSDLNSFAKTAFPEAEKQQGRTERDRIRDLFDNYENYNEAWESAKNTIREKYKDNPDALAVFDEWMKTDLASSFLGQYFGHPDIQIRSDLADRFLKAKTDEERDDVIDEIMDDIAAQIPATWQEKFRALRYMNMLGNFKTQVRNVFGNAAMIPVRRTKDMIGAVIEGGLALAGKDVERTKSFTRDRETYKTALDDFEAVADIIMDGGKYDDGRNYTKTIEDRRRIFRNALLEGYRKVTNDAMNNGVFGDKAFSRFAYADALARYLTANKVTFGTATPDMLDKARAYAIKQAAEATYRDNNAFSDMISSIRFRNPDTVAKKAANIIVEGILPFRRTPANILVRAIEYNPIGIVLTAAEAAVDKKTTGSVDTTKFIDNLSKNITGLGLAYLGYLLASEGLLRGAAPDDEEKEKYDELLGRQAYSLELPSGRSITLDWLAPGSIPLFLGAQVAQAALEDGFTFRDGLEALGSITDPMLQMSMLQGVNDTLQNASSYGDDSALVRFTGNALWSFVTQGMTNTMLGQIERSLTKDRMTTYVDKNGKLPDGLQRLIGQTSAKTPGWDYSQIPYIDAWGRIDQNAETSFGNVFNQFLNPSYTSRVTVSDMEKELERLYDVTGDPGALPNRASAYFNVNKQRVDLSAEQYVEYAMGSGEYKYNLLTDLIEDPAYAELDDRMKLKTVEKIYDFSSQVMKAQVTGYGPEKWGSGEEAPEDAYGPEKWVVKAYAAPDNYGISASEYIRLAAQVGDVEGIPDENGETITNSASLQKAAIIHKMNLPKEEANKLMEDLGVGKTVRGYSKKEVESKLKELLK